MLRWNSLISLTCFSIAFRKALFMYFEKRLYSQLQQKANTVIRGECCMSRKKMYTDHSHGFNRTAQQLLLPGPTVEFDPSTADISGTVGTADRGMACRIPADGNCSRDTEIPHIQIKIAAVPSVKRDTSLLQQRFHTTHLNALKKKSFLTHIKRYLTLQFPRTLIKAPVTDILTPVPATRFTADVGNPTLLIMRLKDTRC